VATGLDGEAVRRGLDLGRVSRLVLVCVVEGAVILLRIA